MSNKNANLFFTRAQQDLEDAMSMLKAYQQMGAQPYIKRSFDYFHISSFFMPLIHFGIMMPIAFRIIFIGPLQLLQAIFNDTVQAIPKVFLGILYEVAALVLNAIMIMVSLVSCIIKTLSTIRLGYDREFDSTPQRLIYFLEPQEYDSLVYKAEHTIIECGQRELSWV